MSGQRLTGRPMLIVHHPEGTLRVPAIPAESEQLLSTILQDLGLTLNTRCHGQGLCQGCCVELIAGAPDEVGGRSEVPGANSTRTLRACQCRPRLGEDVEIRVPARSLLGHAPQVVTSFALEVSRAHDPLWQRLELDLTQLDAAGPLGKAVAGALSRRRDGGLPVRVCGWDGEHASCAEGFLSLRHAVDHWEALPFAGNVEEPAYGAAIDVGTTTVVVLLVDLADGRSAAVAASLNAQTRLGDNVLTRINLCSTGAGRVQLLQRAVVRKTIAPLIDQVLEEAGAVPSQLKVIVAAGNTTMLHLLAGVDPSPMGVAPFTPRFLAHRAAPWRELFGEPRRALGHVATRAGDRREPPPAADAMEGEKAAREDAADALVHLLPGTAAYVGADVVAGVLSSGMAYRSETCLLIDIGTNGEIVLKHGDRFLACATAAGPAFEGSGLTCGVRAGTGAISHVDWESAEGDPRLEVIGGGQPIGVCGTGYVDFVAQARRVGLLGPTGRFAPDTERLPRFGRAGNTRHYLLACGREGEAVFVSEGDIASLLQAKAAIAAGLGCLLSRAGIAPQDVATVFLAGGFGFHMRVDSVLGCGLMPGFQPDQIRLVGNTSLAGAYLALMDSSALDELQRICRLTETIELNLEPDFEGRFIDQLSLL